MKRVSMLFVAICLLAVAVILVGCAPAAQPTKAPEAAPTQAPAAAEPTAAKKWKVGYIVAGPQFYYACQESGVRKRAKDLGLDLVVLNSDQKAEKELSNMEDLLRQKVDIVVMQTQNSAVGQKAVKLANDAGIPVILLSTQIEKGEGTALSQVLTDFREMGRVAGRWVAKNVSGGKAVVVEGLPGMSVSEDLTAGFKEEAEKNANIKVVGAQPADWDRQKALNVATNFLQANPDVAVMYCQNDDMSMGCIKAIEQAGLAGKVTVVSDNGSQEGADAIKAGTLAASVAGQSPAIAEGVRGVDLAWDSLNGKKIPETVWLDLWMLDKTNLDKAMVWCFENP